MPTPDLSGLEPAVAEQIGQIRRALTDHLGKAGAEPREVAAVYGDLGQVYLAYGWNDAAADCFRFAAKIEDRNVNWAYLLGAAEQAAGRLEPAAEAFRRALDLSLAAGVAAIHLGEIRLLEGRPDEAEAVLKPALDVAALSPAAHSLLGQAALARRDWSAAIEHLEAALAAVPDANRLHHPLALAYRGKGDLAKAEEHLSQAGQVGLKPPDPLLDAVASLRTGERLAMMSGRTAARARRYADAAKEFERALIARPESVEARVNLGSMLANLGDRAGAVEQLREALKRDPENATSHFNLASLLAQRNTSPERQEALTHVEAYLAAHPEDGEAHRLRAQLLRDAGRLEDALLEYARAIELTPGDETARLGEAETLVRLSRYAEARKKLDEGLNQIPGSGLLSHALARLLAACPDRSVRDGKKALELAVAVWNARQASAHAETLALALAESGQCDEAAKWQQKAIDLAKSERLESRIDGLARGLAAYAKGVPCRP
ncbi:MAG: tetratricopeptide repeat protein [Acidobacteriota bacterium]